MKINYCEFELVTSRFLSSLSIKGLIYFLKIMCCLDRKYNRKMCVAENPQAIVTFHFLLHYKVDIFSFLSLSLISDYSASERFLINRSLSPQTHSLLHYKIDIFLFLKAVLVMYYNTPERFLKSRRVIRLFSSYPLRGNFIFLEKYHSDALVFITIERFLRIELVIRQNFFSPYPLRGKNIFDFLNHCFSK